MLNTEGLLGLSFEHGVRDCYSLIREFYRINFGLEMRDYARPDNWWEPDAAGETLNLYMDNFHKEGFNLFHGRPLEYLPGDLFLIAIRSHVPNHAAVLLPGEQILHHLVGQRSCIEPYNRPLFRDNTLAVLRHPKVDGARLFTETEIDAWEFLPKHVRDAIEAQRKQATE